eukprot:TRINITY_DN5546_c0_g1_i1.p1 TRINITY_DN5546_c0_g1~~TRINITY_DN5546_c0_g1_i1.p1  ORF type:complete len:490 (-),score=149.92 TRINITY_DN5546_c0_g1_i1:64-1533(-)
MAKRIPEPATRFQLEVDSLLETVKRDYSDAAISKAIAYFTTVLTGSEFDPIGKDAINVLYNGASGIDGLLKLAGATSRGIRVDTLKTYAPQALACLDALARIKNQQFAVVLSEQSKTRIEGLRLDKHVKRGTEELQRIAHNFIQFFLTHGCTVEFLLHKKKDVIELYSELAPRFAEQDSWENEVLDLRRDVSSLSLLTDQPADVLVPSQVLNEPAPPMVDSPRGASDVPQEDIAPEKQAAAAADATVTESTTTTTTTATVTESEQVTVISSATVVQQQQPVTEPFALAPAATTTTVSTPTPSEPLAIPPATATQIAQTTIAVNTALLRLRESRIETEALLPQVVVAEKAQRAIEILQRQIEESQSILSRALASGAADEYLQVDVNKSIARTTRDIKELEEKCPEHLRGLKSVEVRERLDDIRFRIHQLKHEQMCAYKMAQAHEGLQAALEEVMAKCNRSQLKAINARLDHQQVTLSVLREMVLVETTTR